MIDAASSGVPLVVSDRIGEPERVLGNGKMYVENDIQSLTETLRSFASPAERRAYGDAGRQKMLANFSWNGFAGAVEADFIAAVQPRQRQAAAATANHGPASR